MEEVEKYIQNNKSSEIKEYNKNDSFISSPTFSEKMKMNKSY